MHRTRLTLPTVLFPALLLPALVLPGCVATDVHERERLQDPCMQFDQDASWVFLRNKTEAAREGSFGGFGAAAAGGCACQ